MAMSAEQAQINRLKKKIESLKEENEELKQECSYYQKKLFLETQWKDTLKTLIKEIVDHNE